MKCRLCDRPTAAGTGKLCVDCAKALRRARGTSAALAKLPLAPPGTPQATAAPPITLTVAPPAAAARSPRPALWAAIILVAIAVAYVGQQELARTPNTEVPRIDRLPPSLTERVTVEPSPVVARVEEPSWTATGDAVQTSGEFGAAPSGAAMAPAPPAGGKSGAKTAKNANQASKSMPAVPVETQAPKVPEAEPTQLVAAANVAVPVQPVDGAQVLASAMEKCGKETLLSKFVCEQKAYLHYCEDKWEKDPRCVRKVAER